MPGHRSTRSLPRHNRVLAGKPLHRIEVPEALSGRLPQRGPLLRSARGQDPTRRRRRAGTPVRQGAGDARAEGARRDHDHGDLLLSRYSQDQRCALAQPRRPACKSRVFAPSGWAPPRRVRIGAAAGQLAVVRVIRGSARTSSGPTLDDASGESAAAKQLRIEPGHAMSRAMRVRFAPPAAPTIVVMRAKSPVVALNPSQTPARAPPAAAAASGAEKRSGLLARPGRNYSSSSGAGR